MGEEPSQPTVSVVCLAIAAVVLVIVGAPVAADSTDGTNATVRPETPEDRLPAENVSQNIYLVPDVDIQHVDTFRIHWEAGNPSRCYSSDLDAYGIDRGNDDPGTRNDETLLDHSAGTTRTPDDIYIHMNQPGDPTTQPVGINATDQFVLGVVDCATNPDEPGWYRYELGVNGTGYDGESVDTDSVASNHFYVCDCESEAEAREQLGPPPSERTPTSTATAAVTATATVTPAARTATVTATPADRADSTETPPSAESGTATAAPTATPTPLPETRTVTAADTTPADSPGFGGVAALAGLVLSAVALAARRGDG